MNTVEQTLNRARVLVRRIPKTTVQAEIDELLEAILHIHKEMDHHKKEQDHLGAELTVSGRLTYPAQTLARGDCPCSMCSPGLAEV